MIKSSPQFDTYLVNVKSTVKISSFFVAFLENMNFKDQCGSVPSISVAVLGVVDCRHCSQCRQCSVGIWQWWLR